MPEREHRSAARRRELDERARALVNLRGRLTAGAAVAVEVPARAALLDLRAREALVRAVVELFQERSDGRVREAGDLSRLERALQRAAVDAVRSDRLELRLQVDRVLQAARGQRQVGAAGVLTAEAPLGLAVTDEVDGERQAGFPSISGRPERSDRLALSMTAPARTR